MSNQNSRDRDLLLLFDRPHEPLFFPRQDIQSNKEVVFDVPPEYVADRYKPIYGELQNRFGSDSQERIPVTRAGQLPNLNQLKRLGKQENFSLFIPYHRKLAASLIRIFMNARNKDEFFSLATYAREQDLNPVLFNYAFSVAILHRPETKHLPIPTLAEAFPNKFIPGGAFARALAETSIVQEETKRIPIEISKDNTASDLEIEHRIAYFREDLGINLHHWHWHLVYPFDGTPEIVKKDRRGELFYYMHQQIVARYNVERYCNNLGRVKTFNNFREPIREGYFPKLNTQNGTRNWPPRFADATIKDINRETEQLEFEILDLERWRARLFDAIHEGSIKDINGRNVQLTESKGIDILGDLLEASILSLNKNFYGDLHNFGHVAFGACHDPDGRHLEPLAVIGDPATAMRDPIFYRWHALIDEIFQEHKRTLPRYAQDQLTFPGVRVSKVEVTSRGKRNQLNTYWQKSIIDMQRGLDFYPRGAVLAKFTHLQHEPFNFKITVENSNGPKTATCRVFIGPKLDERGRAWNFNDHRLMFIELDKFFVQIKKGTTIIDRSSSQSSVTIPFERTFRSLNQQTNEQLGTPEFAAFNFCGCGWPQHMLIPKGMEGNGYPCQFFVMISDFSKDKVELPKNQQRSCSDAASYCGVRDSNYPDKRSMGYPFDRLARDGVDRLEDFLTPNMSAVDVSIVHTNRTDDKSNEQVLNRFGQSKPTAS